MEDFWADANVISVYSDEQAVEDGALVNLTEMFGFLNFRGQTVNRMTRNLFEQLKPFMLDVSGKTQPSSRSWRDRLEYTASGEMTEGQVRDLRHTLETKLRYAVDTADPGSERGVHFQLPPNLWMVANGSGWTVMLPEDY